MACGSRRGLSLIWHSICLAPASHESVSPATRLPLAGLLIALALAGCSASSTTVPSTAGTTPVQSPNASPGSQDSANVGQGTAVTWQTGDLTLPTAFQFEQLVPIGDRLYLIASDLGGGDATVKASGGIWASADGLTWTKQSGIDAVKSPGADRPTLVAASPNGRGGAVIVGSEQATDGTDRTAAWWTTDGKTWGNASIEGPAGRMLSVAGRPDGLVAVGISFSSVPGGSSEAAAWRSTDGGSSWTSVSLPGGGREARDVTVWGDRFVAIGLSSDSYQLMLWTSSDGASWSLTQSPSDPSFAPFHLIPLGNTLVVLGWGVPGSAILTCGNDMTCARASVPGLGYAASITRVRSGAEVSGTIVVNAQSGIAGTAASPGPSANPAQGNEFLASTDGRTWTTLKSDPSLVVVTSNLVVFRGRLVAVAFAGPNPTAAIVTAVVGELR